MLKDFTKEKFDIIIQAGQSNSEGFGMGKVEEPFVPSPKIWYLENDFTICMAQENVNGNESVANFSLTFSTDYIKNEMLHEGRKLLIIRAAAGGTGFLDDNWKMQDVLFLRMMEMIKTALSLNPENRLVAFLWHQGETDAIMYASEQEHYDNLSTLLNAVRSEFEFSNLPFIAGDFVQHWKMDNIAICEPVIAAIKRVCETSGSAQFVETDELKSNDQVLGNQDPIHFCREAIYLLGHKYFDAFSKIINQI